MPTVLAPSIRFAKFPDTCVSVAVEVRRTCARGSTLMPTVRNFRVGGNLDAAIPHQDAGLSGGMDGAQIPV